jgi:signal transduction histidine kinase
MSYRSIKRVLGETSLERKCRYLFGACLFALITASFACHHAMTEELVFKQQRTTARLLADQVMFIEHWKGFDSDGGYDDLVQNLTKKFNKDDYQWNYILPNSEDGKGAPRDEYEWKLLDKFPKSVPPGTDDASIPKFDEHPVLERNEYRYYQPIRAERLCLHCHRAPPGGSGLDDTGTGVALGNSGVRRGGAPLNEGDLMAIVRVTIPYGPIQHAMNLNRAMLLCMAIVTVFLALIGSYMIIRYVIVKPLRHLRDVSDAISHGNISLRADLHTGDEFEGLAVAFNRMLRHLVTIQDELRHVNVDLDVKVDELAQANMRLYELNRIKSDFLATMSHELRTPLNSILGFSDVLRSIDALDEKQKRYVENIRKSGRILLDMINDILDLAKIESGKMQPRLTEFRLEQVIGAQCDMARPLTEKKNIDLDVQVDPDQPPMRQDQARVQQILNNLLSNAIKFTPEGGRIKVAAQRDSSGYMVMEVIDTGVGIAEEDQQAIFEKFRQGRTGLPGGDAMTREYSGTGLGLSIVRELCRLLGGEVSVQSALGQGSTFTVLLPWRLEDSVSMEPPPNEALEDFAKTRFEIPRDADGNPPVSQPQAT